MKYKGSFYIEIMLALLLVGLLATSFLPILRNLYSKVSLMNKYSSLYSIGEYCSNYVFRWNNLDERSRVIPFEFYNDDDSLEFSGENKVNKLMWANNPTLSNSYLTDHYKVNIIFKDTVIRDNSAGIVITVWYDENLNSLIDKNEIHITLSTIISQKEPS